MDVKLQPRSTSYCSRAEPRASTSQSRCVLTLFVVLLAAACGEPEEGDGDLTNMGNPAQTGDAALPDSGVVLNPVPDAMVAIPFDAGAPNRDAGSINTGFDGAVGPLDASTTSDAGPKSDAGACALTYDNFGKQFLTTYCVSCHAGALAQHMTQLDTLAGVQKNKAAIKRAAVTSTAMPERTPKPSSADRQKLGQWLDCGPN